MSVDELIATARAAGTPDGPRPDPDRRYKPDPPRRLTILSSAESDEIVQRILHACGYTHPS